MYNFLRQGFENIPTVTGPHGEVILNLSKRELDRIEPVPSNVTVLILDHNYIRRLENLENVYDLQQLSVAGNRLLQMHGVANLTHLTILNLPNNGIVAIDGLMKLSRLRWLNLSGNRLKSIDLLDGNINLKHLDLSDNCITQLSDISHLRKLTTLLLHSNRIGSLDNASKYLPRSIDILSLAGNALVDIDEVQNLRPLINLNQFSIQNNPCTNCPAKEYEPIVLAVLPNLRILDGSHVVHNNSSAQSTVMSVDRGPERLDKVPRPETSATNATNAAPTPLPSQQLQQQMPTSASYDFEGGGRHSRVMFQPPAVLSTTAQVAQVSTPTATLLLTAGQSNYPVIATCANEPPVSPNQQTQLEARTNDDTVSDWRGGPAVQAQQFGNMDSVGLARYASTESGPNKIPSTHAYYSSESSTPSDQLQKTEIVAHGDPKVSQRATSVMARPPSVTNSTGKPNLDKQCSINNTALAYDDTPVASIWALTVGGNGMLSSRDDQLDPVKEEPVPLPKSNEYPVNGYSDRMLPAGPRRVSDDFIQSTSSRTGGISGSNGIANGDPGTSSSMLISESVYLPVSNAVPDQTRVAGSVGLMQNSSSQHSTPVRSQTVGIDQMRSLRTSGFSDSFDFTGASQELESSRTTSAIRPFDQSLLPGGTLHSSFSMIPVNNQLLESPLPVGHPGPISPQDTDGNTLESHHSLIDGVRLLNDEEEEEDVNDELMMTMELRQAKLNGYEVGRFEDPGTVPVPVKQNPRIVSRPMEKHDNGKYQNSQQNSRNNQNGERISTSSLTATMIPAGPIRAPCVSTQDLFISPAVLASIANGVEPLQRSGPVKRLSSSTIQSRSVDAKSKSLDSNWLRLHEPDANTGTVFQAKNASVKYGEVSTVPTGLYHAQSASCSGIDTTAAVSVPLPANCRSLPRGNAIRSDVLGTSASTATIPGQTPVEKPAAAHSAFHTFVDSNHIPSNTRSSVTLSQSASETPCVACGLQSNVLRDHIVLLRTQLQAQFKAAEAEARMRQLHSNAIEFLLQEVQELKAWKESVCRSWSVTPLPSTAPNSWLDTNQRSGQLPPPPNGPIEPSTFVTLPAAAVPAAASATMWESATSSQCVRSNKISARGDMPVWTACGSAPTQSVAMQPCHRSANQREGRSGEQLETDLDSTTQLFSRITTLRSQNERPPEARQEIVKVYASDEELDYNADEEKLSRRADPVRNGLNRGVARSNESILPNTQAALDGVTDLPSASSGMPLSEPVERTRPMDEVLDEMELVRQAAIHAMNLSSSPSDGELETPRQSGSVVIGKNNNPPDFVACDTLPEPPLEQTS